MAGRKDADNDDGKIVTGKKDKQPYLCFVCEPELEQRIREAGEVAFDFEIKNRSEVCRKLIEIGLMVLDTPSLREAWRKERVKRARKPIR